MNTSESTGPTGLFDGVDWLGKRALILTGPVALLLQAQSMIYGSTRLWVWVILFLLSAGLFVSTFRRFRGNTTIRSSDPKAVARRPVLAALSLLFVVLICIEIAISHFGLILPADTSFISFTNEFHGGDNLRPNGPPMMLQFDDCLEWKDVAELERPAFLWNRAIVERLAGGYDFAGPLTAEKAKSYYQSPLFEGFAFNIKKRQSCQQLIIHDVDVIVERFVSMPPTAGASPSQTNIDILCVEIEKRKCEDLPWHFGIKFLLDDPGQKAVKRWDGVQYNITDDLQRQLKVKVQAKDRGIYTYRANLLLQTGDSSHIYTVPLVEQPRTCVYSGGPLKDDPPVGESTATPGVPPAPAAPAAGYAPQPPAPPPPPSAGAAPTDTTGNSSSVAPTPPAGVAPTNPPPASAPSK